MQCWQIIFHFTVGAEGANVALGKRITCNEKYVGKGATDGDYNIQTPIVLRMACLALVINLVEEYYLHYVVVYDGIKPSDLGSELCIQLFCFPILEGLTLPWWQRYFTDIYNDREVQKVLVRF